MSKFQVIVDLVNRIIELAKSYKEQRNSGAEQILELTEQVTSLKASNAQLASEKAELTAKLELALSQEPATEEVLNEALKAKETAVESAKVYQLEAEKAQAELAQLKDVFADYQAQDTQEDEQLQQQLQDAVAALA